MPDDKMEREPFRLPPGGAPEGLKAPRETLKQIAERQKYQQQVATDRNRPAHEGLTDCVQRQFGPAPAASASVS